ncbi:T9SS type A sorting domain-containing protein [Chryseobacterium sp. SSA4.19]|uniref:T9SS type A sorting domain-containing protein n=1 Tax=Chryseobacterium sp. SSA4.19 TaxID=2919915 RepID=UPI001F4D3FB1|nr:T9SS type A sorting domain-containing protein [Chryseobacterium sp. SSA4.19]MCJ8154322.1 T9SS type A sorting domain-containing protein [Chryseobacterium sp. SSA4.19]
MKKTLFLLLASSLLTAQTSELLSNSWYISKMVTNSGQTTNTPLIDGGVLASTFNSAGGTSYVFNSKYYNTSLLGFGIMPGSNNMIKTAGGCTLAYYNGGNAFAVRNYDQKNCDVYNDGGYASVYNYQITTNCNVKTLVITDPSGNKVYYNNTLQLSTKENELIKKVFTIYPNPVKEDLHIENIEKNLTLKIFDLSGKLVYETTTADRKMKIETNTLQKGQYILSIENYTSVPFIKE